MKIKCSKNDKIEIKLGYRNASSLHKIHSHHLQVIALQLLFKQLLSIKYTQNKSSTLNTETLNKKTNDDDGSNEKKTCFDHEKLK